MWEELGRRALVCALRCCFASACASNGVSWRARSRSLSAGARWLNGQEKRSRSVSAGARWLNGQEKEGRRGASSAGTVAMVNGSRARLRANAVTGARKNYPTITLGSIFPAENPVIGVFPGIPG